jgi:nitrate reductase delta subunit
MDEFLSHVSTLYTYPDESWRRRLAVCTDEAGDHSDAVYEPMRALFDWVSQITDHRLQEAYTSTFDLSPSCTLEVGWHLFGEDYNRGGFMARLRDQYMEYEVEETIELPDHLTNVLPLLVRMEHDKSASLCNEIVLPSLASMRDTLEKEASPFEPLLAATIAELKDQFEIEQIRPIIKQDKSIPMEFMGKGMTRG